jgi:hypothetical protein
MMHEQEKSDPAIVAAKPTSTGGPVERSFGDSISIAK